MAQTAGPVILSLLDPGPAGEKGKPQPWSDYYFAVKDLATIYAVDPFGNGLCFVDEKTLYTGE